VFLLIVLAGAAFAQHLRIYHIDVEQGDATLFISPSGSTMLIDAGNNGMGQRIRSVLAAAGASRIDVLVNTHYHADHYGGTSELAPFQIVSAYDRGDTNFLTLAKRREATFRSYQNAVAGRRRHLMRGETVPFDPEVSVTCVASGGAVLGEPDPSPGVDENDMSVALLVQYGTFKYFLGGDIENHTEDKIAERHLVKNVDVYQADHHGSHTSSSSSLMDDLKPSVIIISNGDRADYMHPRRTTLQRYAGMNPVPMVFQTNRYTKGGLGGNVPTPFIADTTSTGDSGTILITVDASVGTFKVSYRDIEHVRPIKGGARASPGIVIESVLPDPIGSDTQLEEITLRNKGSVLVSTIGWVLQDRSGRVWSLSTLGSIPAGQSTTIRRNGMAMNLNNDGDEIVLYDEHRVERDRFTYTTSQEGVRIATGH
jgi:beta-lactamase superfamily II metal-dependent hydrolase